MKILLLTVIALGMMRPDAGAQDSRGAPEFSYEEFRQALRPLMSEAEARAMARQFAMPASASLADLGIPPGVRPSTGTPRSVVGHMSEDMLMMLALVSDDTRRKVDRFRLAVRGGTPFTVDEQRAWDERFRQFTEWKAAGFPTIPPGANAPPEE